MLLIIYRRTCNMKSEVRSRRLLTAIVALLLAVPNLKAQRAQNAPAQPAEPSWEIAAGGKMSFDVVSVKQDKSGKPFPPKFALDDGDSYPGNMTLFTSGFPLTTDIAFAYKLPPGEQLGLQSQLPKWALTKTFDIEARAAVPRTKDQMRLMMQSLLEERFKLKAHFETSEKPVFALVLVNARKTGPQLRPYVDDPPCTDVPASPPDIRAPGFKMTVGEFPPMCYAVMLIPGNMSGTKGLTWGSRRVSMQQVANDLGAAPTTNLDRPVVDKTGLSGNFDFVMTYVPTSTFAKGDAESADSGPTFLEALKDQLGLKLESTTGSVTTLVIDHIEEPTPN